MEVFLGWTVLSIAVGIGASSRGRSGFGWFLISLLLSPLIGAFLVLVFPKIGPAVVSRDTSGEVITAETHVRCPDCRELVRSDARKCKHCGTALVPVQI